MKVLVWQSWWNIALKITYRSCMTFRNILAGYTFNIWLHLLHGKVTTDRSHNTHQVWLSFEKSRLLKKPWFSKTYQSNPHKSVVYAKPKAAHSTFSSSIIFFFPLKCYFLYMHRFPSCFDLKKPQPTQKTPPTPNLPTTAFALPS